MCLEKPAAEGHGDDALRRGGGGEVNGRLHRDRARPGARGAHREQPYARRKRPTRRQGIRGGGQGAEKEAADSQADLADYNAAVAELQAKDAETRGAEEANRFRKSVNVMVGAQRAGFAAGNIDVGFGSAVDVQADAAFLGELDALTIQPTPRARPGATA
jgi:hypothetical protein